MRRPAKMGASAIVGAGGGGDRELWPMEEARGWRAGEGRRIGEGGEGRRGGPGG
jgi:hypothetical protein